MRKFFLIVTLIFLNEHIFGQTLIRPNDGSIIQESESILPKTRRTIKNVERGILVTYEFDYIEKIPDDTYTEASIIRFDGFGIGGEMEKPALPIKIDRFSVPSKNSKVIIVDSTYIELPMEIGPVKPPMKNNDNGESSGQFVKPIRPYQGLYPQHAVSNVVKAYRKCYIADICVMPVQYNYQEKKARIFSKLSYLVVCENGIKRADCSTPVEDDALLSNMVMNPVDTATVSRDTATEAEVPDYLILSVPQFSNAVNKFADWKRTIGFDVQTIYQDSWTDTDVINAVASSNLDNSLKYLLIVGDYENIPGKIVSDSVLTTSGWEHYTYATDYLYGCFQQNTYPDIRRGRLSVSSVDEAMSVVNKIILYERNPVTQQNFYNTGLNCAYFQDNNKYKENQLIQPRDSIEDVRFTLTSENIRDYLKNVKDKTVNRVYTTRNAVTPKYWNNKKYGFFNNLVTIPDELLRSSGFQWNGNASNITQHINNGAFYVLHRDHGSIEGWADPSFSINNIDSLSNGRKLPVVFSMNCLTGRYNGNTCFAEAFLRKEGGGCVAIIAASEESLSGYNDALTIGMFDAIWPSNGYFKSFPHSHTISLSSTPAYRLGDILDIGLSHISTIYEYANTPMVLQHTKQIFHCFGDPAMEIYTEKPNIFNDVSFSVVNGVAHITVPEGGKITFYNPITGNINSYDGSSIQYPYNSNLRIAITGHNKVPLIIEAGTIFIQNEAIAEDVSYEAQTIKVGSNVTTAKPNGEVIISSGITKLKGNTVELSSGTTIELGAQLEINN